MLRWDTQVVYHFAVWLPHSCAITLHIGPNLNHTYWSCELLIWRIWPQYRHTIVICGQPFIKFVTRDSHCSRRWWRMNKYVFLFQIFYIYIYIDSCVIVQTTSCRAPTRRRCSAWDRKSRVFGEWRAQKRLQLSTAKAWMILSSSVTNPETLSSGSKLVL